MTNSDTSRFQMRDVAAALGLLTRLPVQVDGDWAAARGAGSAWAFPLVGLVVGIIGAVIATSGGLVGLPAAVTAGLVLTVAAAVTGALHEDGLADCADGFWGGWDRARRLEIMKDSRIGAYGVLALVFAVGLKWVALAAAFEGGLVWAAVVVPAVFSRAAMVWVMHALPFARTSGLAQSVGRPDRQTAVAAIAVAIVAALVSWVSAFALFAVIAVAAIAAWTVSRIARAKIGGQTGDVLGGTQQVVEIAVLLALVALA